MPFVNTNGINFYFEERGSINADPLLLIMGITAPGSVWEPHVQAWEKEFRCILGDNRGVGQTDKPKGPYSTEQMADDYAGLLDSLNLENVRVVGCSMGSTIAQQLAIRHPKKVKSMVLMCPWARCDNYAAGIFQHMAACKANLKPEQFVEFIQLLIFSKNSWDNPELYLQFLEDRRKAASDENPQPLHGLEGQAAACIAHNVLDHLGAINQKTLIIGGKEDIFTPVWMAKEITEAIPNSDLYLYENAGHAFHFEQTEDFNKRVLNWLKKH